MTAIPERALTHGGKFHADDVFSAALLRLLNPSVEIRRVFSIPEDCGCLVFDLGRGAFDHHQPDAPRRENGVPYAAFGLLWRAFGAGLLGAEEAARFDRAFVQPLDLDDNTGCGDTLAGVIGAFNPGWDSEEDPDICFERAVAFARAALERKLESARSVERGRALTEAALAELRDGVVILPRYAPWKSVLVKSPAEFVVYPSQRGGYSAQAIPMDDETGALKRPFPAAWAGLSDISLAELSGIAALRFCHNNCFLIAADTLEGAVAACALARA